MVFFGYASAFIEVKYTSIEHENHGGADLVSPQTSSKNLKYHSHEQHRVEMQLEMEEIWAPNSAAI